jgi:hypothetical protein
MPAPPPACTQRLAPSGLALPPPPHKRGKCQGLLHPAAAGPHWPCQALPPGWEKRLQPPPTPSPPHHATQGLHALGAPLPQLQELFANVTNLAAFHSLVVGELPGMGRQRADNFLAEFGLLGCSRQHADPEVAYGRWASICCACLLMRCEGVAGLVAGAALQRTLGGGGACVALAAGLCRGACCWCMRCRCMWPRWRCSGQPRPGSRGASGAPGPGEQGQGQGQGQGQAHP